MKKYFTLIIVTTVILLGGCKSNKITSTTPKKSEEVKVEEPCLKESLQDGKGMYRVHAIGKSIDQQESKSSAVDIANSLMADRIINNVQRTAGIYEKNVNLQSGNEFERNIQRETKSSTNTFIVNAKVICLETYKTSEGIYKTYLCLEVSPEAEKNYFKEQFKNTSELMKLKYDEELFEKSFKEGQEEFEKQMKAKSGSY